MCRHPRRGCRACARLSLSRTALDRPLGADIGNLDEPTARDLLRAGVNPVVANVVDESVKVADLPEHWTGWVGRTGISGSRQGRDWSPKFSTVAIRVNGAALEPQPGLTVANSEGPGWWSSTPLTRWRSWRSC
jgi:hypothetical protein